MPDPADGSLSAEGAQLLDEDRPAEAVAVLRRALAGGEPEAADLLVRAYLDSGSWQACIDWLAPHVAQGELQFAGRLGVAYAELGDTEGAERALRLAVDNGEDAAANDLAILLRDLDRMAEAIHVLTRAAEDGDRQAPANLVALRLEAGDLAAAAEAAEKYVHESRPDTLVALGDVRAAEGRSEAAEHAYRRAIELGGGLRAHTAYGHFLLAAHADGPGAEEQFREAWRHNEPGWAYTLGRFLVEDGRPDEAREFLEAATSWGDRDASDLLDEINGVDPADD
jgi:tetratricopeptide (TPR) repeat protein